MLILPITAHIQAFKMSTQWKFHGHCMIHAICTQENLELASELTEASRDRHAKEDAHHMLRERCSELQVGTEGLMHIGGPIQQASSARQPRLVPVYTEEITVETPGKEVRKTPLAN